MNVHFEGYVKSQPLAVVQVAEALLKLRTVQALSGLGRTSLYSRIKSGELKAIRLSSRCVRFRASDVQQFLQGLGKEAA